MLTYFQLGLSNLYQGKLNLALDYYNKSLQYNQRNILPSQSLASLVNTAIIFEKQYRFAEASKTYRKALEFSEQIKDSVSIAGIWLNLGILSHRMKDDDKALEILEKTGFRSRQSFHRNFKSATGFTPKEYREMSAGFRPDESEVSEYPER